MLWAANLEEEALSNFAWSPILKLDCFEKLETFLRYFASQLQEFELCCYTNISQAFVLVTALLLVKHPMAANRKWLSVQVL